MRPRPGLTGEGKVELEQRADLAGVLWACGPERVDDGVNAAWPERAGYACGQLAVLLLVEVVHQLRDDYEVVRLVAELVGERVAGTVNDAITHPFGGEQGRRVLDGLGQIEHHGAQAIVAATQHDRVIPVRAADVEHVMRRPGNRQATGDLGCDRRRQCAHAPLVGGPLIRR